MIDIERIAKTGYLTSVVSYGAFWLMDAARPGFVARFFSVHIFLLSAILFGVVWAKTAKATERSGWIWWAVAIPVGLGAAVLTWNLGEGLAEFRVLVTALASIIPLIALSVIRSV